MIQRIQSIYLLLVLAALIVLTIGTDIYVTTVQKENQFELISHANVYGIQKDYQQNPSQLSDENLDVLRTQLGKVALNKQEKEVATFYFPFFSIGILLSMLTVVVLFAYKNLERQKKLGGWLLILNLLTFIASILLYYTFTGNTIPDAEGLQISTELRLGFVCIPTALVFSFLAYRGINRDLKLIKSIDRIR